jgi:thiamine-phosphate pyrophosphorylase
MSRFPRLYAIADRATLDSRGISVGEFARELREAGVRLVQYRDKVNGPQEILRATNEIDAAFEGAEVTRIMNDRADLAVLAGWDGVHVGQGDLGVAAARRVLVASREIQGSLRSGLRPPVEMTTSGIVGVSTHSEEQVQATLEMTPDYVAVGPVFATASKSNADPIVGLELVRKARTITKLPIVAIGGITLANARSVVEAGADAVAVISALFESGQSIAEVAGEMMASLQ